MGTSASVTSNMRVAPFTIGSGLQRLGARVTRVIWCVTFAMVLLAAASAAIWMATGDEWPLVRLFHSYTSWFLIGLALLEFFLAVGCWLLFEPGEPLRRAWLFLSLASAFRLAGLESVTLLSGFGFDVSPLTANAASSPLATIRAVSLGALNPFAFSLMLVGLFLVLQAYHRVGLLKRPRPGVIVLLLAIGALVVSQLIPVGLWWSRLAGPISFVRTVGWVTGPLLGLLLLQAILLYRAVAHMGDGLVASCWGAYTIAIFLTSFGDMGLWALAEGRMPWQYGYVNSVVWLAAALAFALAPAYQVEAIVRAPNAGAVAREGRF